jgi:hypothetical protein
MGAFAANGETESFFIEIFLQRNIKMKIICGLLGVYI